MINVEILIPVKSNEGVDFSDADHEAFELFLARLFGGYTLNPDTATGEWRNDEGQIVPDTLRVYSVGIGSIIEGGKVRDLVTFALAQFAQDAICIRYLGLIEILS